MTPHEFKAYGLHAELDLNRIANAMGIHRKFRWEEAMILNPTSLELVAGERNEPQQVYLYYFGGIVFLNCSHETELSFFSRMAKYDEVFRNLPVLKYNDEYSLRIDSGENIRITNDYAVMPVYDHAFIGIIAFVVAKSVALERIEEQVDTVLDEIEGLITLLGKGKLNIPDKTLAKTASRILGFKYSSLSQIMILDKPEITWENPVADRLYLTLANLFELNQRYQEIKHKSETLLDVTQVFTSLSHARRATRLEWIIIVLIFIEIIIYLFEIIR